MSRTSTAGMLSRHLRTAPGAPLTVAVMVFVLSALTVLGPLALTALTDAAVRHRLSDVSAAARDVEASVARPPVVGPGSAPDLPPGMSTTWGMFDAGVEKGRLTAGEPVTSVLDRADYVVRYGKLSDPVETTFVALDPQYESRIRVVDGRLPAPPAPLTDRDMVELFSGLGDGRIDAMPPVEIVLSHASAERAGWSIGDTRTVAGEAGWPIPQPLTLTGTFEPVDADATYWQHATGILTASVTYDVYGEPFVSATGFAAPGAVSALRVTDNVLTTAWYPFDVEAVNADNAGATLAGLRGFTSANLFIGPREYGWGLAFHTDALTAIEIAVSEDRSLRAMLAMLASGPVGVAIAVIVLGCRMMIERRRAALRLLSARGASDGQLRGLLALEGLLVGLAPAALGAAGAFVLASIAFGSATTPLATPALLVAPTVLGVLPGVALAASVLRVRDARVDAPARVGGWRLIVELAVVGLAALATALLVVRGVGKPDEPFDPLVAVAPLLLALVVCVLTLRLYPLLLRGLLSRERRGTGFVGYLGAARALRDPATGLAPVLGLVVGVSVAVSSGVLLSTVQSGAESAARAAVGADLQLSASRFDDGAESVVADLDGVERVAPVSQVSPAEVRVDSNRKLVSLYLVDGEALDAVQAGHPALIPSDVAFGDGEEPMPLVFSERAFATLHPDTGELVVAGTPSRVAGVVQDMAPFARSSSWLLADASYAAVVRDVPPPVVSILVRLEPGADAAAVAAAAQDALGDGVSWSSPQTVLASVESGPAAAGLRFALLLFLAVAAALSAIAVVMTLVLGTRGRRRILALLQTLGAPPRSGTALVVWEPWPVCSVALVTGVALGSALPTLLLRVVDLQPFTGGLVQPSYVADPLVLGAALGGFAVLTALFTLIALAISRRARAAEILRTVEET